ncbi:unnamed protein product [Prunus armeniaca]
MRLLKIAEELQTSHDLYIKSLLEISSRNLDNWPRGKILTPILFQPCVPPTPLEENEVDEECVIDKDADELAIELSTQVDLPIEKLTLIERKESTQRDKTQKVVEVEDRNTIQSETAIPRNVDLQSSKRGGWNMNQSYALIIDMVI